MDFRGRADGALASRKRNIANLSRSLIEFDSRALLCIERRSFMRVIVSGGVAPTTAIHGAFAFGGWQAMTRSALSGLRSFALAMVAALSTAASSRAFAQPIDPAGADGIYCGGGLRIAADDLRRIAVGLPPESVTLYGDGSLDPTVADAIDSPGSSTSNTPVPRTPIPTSSASPFPRGGTGRVLLVECNGDYGYSTIQSAIDDAVDGDVVVILPNDCTEEGQWFENIDFLGKAIRVQSANPFDDEVVERTVIETTRATSGSLKPIITFQNGESSDSELVGITLSNINVYLASPDGTNVSLGAIRCDSSSPTIRNCRFFELYGGTAGIWIQGESLPAISECSFSQCLSTNGALQIWDSPGPITISDCEFLSNSSTGISAISSSPNSNAGIHVIENCEFRENRSWGGEPAVIGRFLIRSCQFIDTNGPVVELGLDSGINDCLFVGNTGKVLKLGRSTILNSRFENNSPQHGPVCEAIFCEIDNCEFIANRSTAFGGAIYARRCSITDCLFENNEGNYGGAVWLESIGGSEFPTILRDCEFIGNSAIGRGGALFLMGNSELTVSNVSFIANRSLGGGGAAYVGSSTIEDSLFVGNIAGEDGGAIFNEYGDIKRCTLVGNRSVSGGGAVRNFVDTNIESCIVSQNRDPLDQAVYSPFAIYPSIRSSNLHDKFDGAAIGQNNNISLDPRFIDPGHWDDMGTPDDLTDDVFVPGDYRLLPDSPCIDSGDPDFIPDENATDLAGEPRVMSCRVDMGAYEFVQDDVTVVGDFNGDGVVTLLDLPEFVAVTLDPYGIGVCVADVNGDRRADGRDVSEFVGFLVGP